MLLLFVLFAGVTDVAIPFGAPISDADWAVREDASRQIFDAVVLEEIIVMNPNQRQRYRRVRILSESGKDAAELVLPASVKKIQGRVILPNGEERRFNKEDLVEVLAAKQRRRKTRARVLVPPGLTSDCIVELAWTVPVKEYGPWDSLGADAPAGLLFLRGDFHVQKFIAAIPAAIQPFLASSWSGQPEVQQNTKKNRVKLTYRDLPPLDIHPFDNDMLNPDMPYIRFTLMVGEDHLANFTDQWLVGRVNVLNRLAVSSAYVKWVKELKANRPADDFQAMMYVYDALRHRVRSLRLLPEDDPRPEKLTFYTASVDAWIKRAFDLGVANSELIKYLYEVTLKRLKIDYRQIYAGSRFGEPFIPKNLNYMAVMGDPDMFAVQLPDGRWAAIAPHLQENPPGFLPEAYQGVPALAVNPKTKEAEVISLPMLSPNVNTHVHKYKIDVGEDGKVAMKVSEQRNGTYQGSSRRKYQSLAEDARSEEFRRIWERRLPEWEITGASVINGDNISLPMGFQASGQYDMEGLGVRFSLDPFPGALQPLRSPDYWGPDRKGPIVMTGTFNRVDLTKITLPQGWKVLGNPSWQRKNPLGSVSLRVVQEGNLVTVRRDVMLGLAQLPPHAEADLRFFLAWMEEAFQQTLAFGKSS